MVNNLHSLSIETVQHLNRLIELSKTPKHELFEVAKAVHGFDHWAHHSDSHATWKGWTAEEERLIKTINDLPDGKEKTLLSNALKNHQKTKDLFELWPHLEHYETRHNVEIFNPANWNEKKVTTLYDLIMLCQEIVNSLPTGYWTVYTKQADKHHIGHQHIDSKVTINEKLQRELITLRDAVGDDWEEIKATLKLMKLHHKNKHLLEGLNVAEKYVDFISFKFVSVGNGTTMLYFY